MTRLLVTLTVVEIALLLAVLATYVVLITRRLRRVSSYIAKIAFGVRAVETQTAGIGPGAVRLNSALRRIAELLGVPVPATATDGKKAGS